MSPNLNQILCRTESESKYLSTGFIFCSYFDVLFITNVNLQYPIGYIFTTNLRKHYSIIGPLIIIPQETRWPFALETAALCSHGARAV